MTLRPFCRGAGTAALRLVTLFRRCTLFLAQRLLLAMGDRGCEPGRPVSND